VVSPCSSSDSGPSYDILDLADVEFYSAERCQ
jgi:hypothetical protein